MAWDADKENELALILDRFTGFIRSQFYRAGLNCHGLDIDDVLQETRIKLWKIILSEKKIKNYASYIKKIVNSSVMDLFRKFKREEDVCFHQAAKHIGENGFFYEADYLYEGFDLKDIVGKALESLIESRRKVVKLYLLNFSIQEIALYFHWSPHKARNLLYRGLLDLKRILKDKKITYEHQP